MGVAADEKVAALEKQKLQLRETRHVGITQRANGPDGCGQRVINGPRVRAVGGGEPSSVTRFSRQDRRRGGEELGVRDVLRRSEVRWGKISALIRTVARHAYRSRRRPQ